VYTGATTVHLFGARDIKALVRALRPFARDQPSSRSLPAPRFPDLFWRRLRRFERVHRRRGSVAAAARTLRVTPKAVRDKLALGRLLRRHGIRRHAACA
jgi:hypothetical protein